MPNAGGRYEIRGGKRVQVHNTNPAPRKKAPKPGAKTPEPTPAAVPVNAESAAPKPTKPVAKKEVTGDE